MRGRKTYLIILMILVISAGVLSASEFKLDVKKFQLDNGLTILLLENRAAPVISYYTFFKVGSRNERPGITGISHFFEHMMFNGAKKYGPKMFDQVLESNGGYSNAYTSNNLTAYFQDFSSGILDKVVDLEIDRLAYLAFEPEMLKSEIGVVKEERRMGPENSNEEMVYEDLFATAFLAHSYSWPVIGWMADLNNISRQDCLTYHSTYYTPNNAVLVIVGDFDADEAFAMLKKNYDPIPAGPPPPPVCRNEPEQRGSRRTSIVKQSEYGHFMRGYHVGDKDSPELPAMEILQFVLTTGESCRMYQALVYNLQIATGLYGGFDWGFDPSLFYFYVGAAPEVPVARIEQAFDSVLTRFIAEGPTPDELTRAKNSLTARFYKEFKTNNGTAHQIGYYQTLYGDYTKMYSYVGDVAKITTEDVKNAAAKYFTERNSTTSVLVPEGGAQ